jgi:hypothetical protein
MGRRYDLYCVVLGSVIFRIPNKTCLLCLKIIFKFSSPSILTTAKVRLGLAAMPTNRQCVASDCCA